MQKQHSIPTRGKGLSPSALPLWGPICSTVSRPGPPSTGKMCSWWRGSRGWPQGWSEGWSTSLIKKGWGSWACSAWKRRFQGDITVAFQCLKKPINKMVTNFSCRMLVIEQWAIVLNKKKGDLDIRRKLFTQRVVRPRHSCPEKLWCPIPGGAQGQVGWDSEKPALVGSSPAHGRGIGTGWAFRSLPT